MSRLQLATLRKDLEEAMMRAALAEANVEKVGQLEQAEALHTRIERLNLQRTVLQTQLQAHPHIQTNEWARVREGGGRRRLF